MLGIQGTHFVDEYGRTVLLRGVNVAGSSKIPAVPLVEAPDPRFYDHRMVSFVGRPFPLSEADEHFTRLRQWGLTFLRFVVTWEALAHAGPNEIDTDYIEYVHALLLKAGAYGFQVLIDAHQDVWSRFTGGDGAPGWTLEAVGFDLTHMTDTGAALLDHTHPRRPALLVWATNYARLAPATMFTLFYAGNDFAPATRIEGVSAQDYLQGHYIAAFTHLAQHLLDVPCVVGYEVMNEPSRGYIGWRNLRSVGHYVYHPTPSPFEGMLLGAGLTRRVWYREVNTKRARAWQAGRECVWKENGVWDTDSRGVPHLLRPNYFVRAHNREVTFRRDYYPPFAKRFAASIHAIDPDALIFIQGEPAEPAPVLHANEIPNMVYAPHWYDGTTLLARRYWNHLGVDMLKRRVVLGANAVQRSFAAQLGVYHYEAEQALGGVPVVLGEFGIPFDLHNAPFLRAADKFLTTRAMDRSFRALESNLMSGTVWNYTPDNTPEHGDWFNGEDLSIFSCAEQTDPQDPDSGGRALRAITRPYPSAVAGEPLRMHYDWLTRVFEFEFRSDATIAAPTEIIVPPHSYPAGFVVEVSDGEYWINRDLPQVIYQPGGKREHTIRILPRA